jgi:hypothetical protein
MLDQGYFVALVLLDFSKASIDHLLLCRKLEGRYGISSSTVSFLSSYLSLRFQCVSYGGWFSDLLPVNVGVPQGSVFGTLLFSLFIDDACGTVLLSNYRGPVGLSSCRLMGWMFLNLTNVLNNILEPYTCFGTFFYKCFVKKKVYIIQNGHQSFYFE